jgi:hypothetical protein
MTLSITTFSMTIEMQTFSTTLILKRKNVEFNTTYTKPRIMAFSIATKNSTHSLPFLYTECHIFIVILSDITLSIVMLSVDKIPFFDEVSLCLKMSTELNKLPVACTVNKQIMIIT